MENIDISKLMDPIITEISKRPINTNKMSLSVPVPSQDLFNSNEILEKMTVLTDDEKKDLQDRNFSHLMDSIKVSRNKDYLKSNNLNELKQKKILIEKEKNKFEDEKFLLTEKIIELDTFLFSLKNGQSVPLSRIEIVSQKKETEKKLRDTKKKVQKLSDSYETIKSIESRVEEAIVRLRHLSIEEEKQKNIYCSK